MLNRKNKKLGFTLIEILVVMTIFAVIGTLSWRFILTGFKATTFNAEQEQAISNARRALEIISKEVRGANNSEQGGYPLLLIDDQEFIFFTDTDGDEEIEKVRYFLDDSKLYKVATDPGALNDYTGSVATTTVANFINNDEEAIFLYYDSDYNDTATINEVRLISIILKVNVTPEIAPNDYYVETDVNLRNLKDNL